MAHIRTSNWIYNKRGPIFVSAAKFRVSRLSTKEFDMSTTSTHSRLPGSSISGFSRFSSNAKKVFVSRSAAIIGLTGLTALVAGFRLATNGGAEGEEMFRAWMIAWAVIWFALAGVCLRLLKPLYDFFVTDQIAQLDAYKVTQMRRLHPGFDQELRSLALYQQLRDERAADAAKAQGDRARD
jgi:hypothetical protein